MTTETQPEQTILSDSEAKPEKAGAQPASHRVAYKTVLTALVIGILTISVLWVFVIRQEGTPVNTSVVTDSDIPVHVDTAAKGSEVAPIDDGYGVIDRRLASMSGRIDRGFNLQQTHTSDMKRSLVAMAESLQSIKEAIADLGESNQALGQHISQATSRLDTLIKNVRALKVAKRKSAVKHKPHPAKIPPFHTDAIDVWDDVTYVAISQAGRVAFLKVGEQQSGWTVTRIDHLKEQVDFQGPASQVHSVSLQR
jgi:hypothetical protein